MPPKLTKVIRLDSMPLNRASFTPEGYLKDRPVLTSIGIFEYGNPDGSIRRELRLPEDVFDADSLKSYRGKPIILTHDAGLVNKDNVAENQVGTILSNGVRDGDDVRADIIIHDTDAMKDSGLKELSLGYNLDLDETPGVWNGQHYDAIQRNIRINHLALVREARAGEQARLNIDSRDANTLIGGKCMRKVTPRRTHRNDGILSPDELAKAIEEYKARRKMAEKTDADDEEFAEEEVEEKKVPMVEEDEDEMPEDIKEQAEFLKEKKDHRDEEPEPETDDELKQMLKRQDEDMDVLFDIIDTLLAEKDFDSADDPEAVKEEQDPDDIIKDADEDDEWMKEDEDEEEYPDEEEEDSDDEGDYDELLTKKDCKKRSDEDDEEEIPEDEENLDGDDEEEPIPEDEEENLDDDDEDIPFRKKEEDLNMDAVDRIVRQRIRLGMIGKSLHMDGLENMSIRRAKKAIIKAVRPKVRLDGKSEAYINAMFECAVADVREKTRKDTKYQKRQMFNKDSASRRVDRNSADAARQRMIKRHSK